MNLAIYREFRPKVFDKLYGQEHIYEILKNQIKNSNISHAYIFSGIRGTGKTSCAKILAKAVNCLNAKDGNPCNECENCKLIEEEKTMDIIEMDAASNRRIDDMRALKEKVIYAPSKLKYKVYIIDEAHMITNEGFNALLKIMEEPPKYLIFILATTEIEKIPETILSRCQRFDFKRIKNEDIVRNIMSIADELKFQIDENAAYSIAQRGTGSMRDALSSLDKVYSMGLSSVSIDDVNEILGLSGNEAIFKIVQNLIEKDLKGAIINYRELIKRGVKADFVVERLAEHYGKLLRYKATGDFSLLDEDMSYENIYKEQISNVEINELTDSLNLFLEGTNLLKLTDIPETMVEVILSNVIDFADKKSIMSRLNYLERKVEYFEKVMANTKIPEEIKKVSTKKIEIKEKREDVTPELKKKKFANDKGLKDENTINLEEYFNEIQKAMEEVGDGVFFLSCIKGALEYEFNGEELSFLQPELSKIYIENFNERKQRVEDAFEKVLGKRYKIKLIEKKEEKVYNNANNHKEKKELEEVDDFFG